MSAARAAAVLLAGAVLTSGCDGRHPPDYTHRCMSRLYQLDRMMRDMLVEGTLRPLPGRRFLLQTADSIREDEDLRVFCCPEDPLAPQVNERGRLYCSFFGPDAETAERWMRDDLPEPAILACDGFGESGEAVTHKHRNSVVVLWSNGRCDTIPVKRVAGYGTPGFRIGPGCPDARFARLRR